VPADELGEREQGDGVGFQLVAEHVERFVLGRAGVGDARVVDEDDARAGGVEDLGEAVAESGRGAGDECDPAVESKQRVGHGSSR
jgi:hypothetical protein